jgi:hypothetical protein
MGFFYFFYHISTKRKRLFLLSVVISFLAFAPLYPAEVGSGITVQASDTAYHLTNNDLKTGERLFYGLIREQAGQESCVSCHSIKPTGQFNWNPSAFEIASSGHTKTLDDLKSVLHSPTGKRLSIAHTGYTNLTDDQLVKLKGYLTDYYEKGGYKPRPVINRLIYFSGLSLVFILFFLDLVWFRKIRYRLIHAAVLIVAAVFITKVIVEESIALGRSESYEPDQPIKFSHMVHAGQNGIDCMYCHSTAEFGKSAGMPSANVCLNCHMVVRDGTRSGRFEISKIFAAIDSKEPIEWTRVYNLPDHAFFSHAQHVGAGKISCQTCHGTVEQMDRIMQVPDLSMGWCIDCHRNTEVQFHDNKFYENYGELKKKLESGEISSVTVEMVGGTDCMKCHY